MTLSVLERIAMLRSDEQVAAADLRDRPRAARGTCCDCGRPTYRTGAQRCSVCSSRHSNAETSRRAQARKQRRNQ